LISAVLAVMSLYAAFGTDSGLPAWQRMDADLAGAQVRIERLRDEIADLERNSNALESDPFAIEAAIREDLRLAQPGEQIIRLSPMEHTNPRFP
jgi:cell division protein FtsB